MGRFQRSSHVVTLDNPSITSEDGTSKTLLGEIVDWYDGSGWYDTKLVSPVVSTRDDFSRDIVFVTAQKNELLNARIWTEMESGAVVLLQMTHMAYYDPTKPDRRLRFIRAVYHDDSPHDWTFPMVAKYIGTYKARMTTIGACMCHQRPPHLAQLPYNFETLQGDVVEANASEYNSLNWKRKQGVDQEGRVIGIGVNMTEIGLAEMSEEAMSRRRLAAVVGKGFLGAIKDKNWSPFVVEDRRVLWSYMLDPHIVCENDVDITKDDNVDCVLCKRKYATKSSVFQLTSTRLIAADKLKYLRSPNIVEHSHEALYHLNGLPSFLVGGSSYIGVGHYILGKMSRNLVTEEEDYVKQYVHFFYRISALPPYEVLDLSDPIPLKMDRSIACWFKPFEVVDVAFVNGFDYLPEEGSKGSVLLSYGVGDKESWTLTMRVEEVFALFPGVTI